MLFMATIGEAGVFSWLQSPTTLLGALKIILTGPVNVLCEPLLNSLRSRGLVLYLSVGTYCQLL